MAKPEGEFDARPVAVLLSQVPDFLREATLPRTAHTSTCLRKGRRVVGLTKCQWLPSQRNPKRPTEAQTRTDAFISCWRTGTSPLDYTGHFLFNKAGQSTYGPRRSRCSPDLGPLRGSDASGTRTAKRQTSCSPQVGTRHLGSASGCEGVQRFCSCSSFNAAAIGTKVKL